MTHKMFKILVTNDLNDINSLTITHFSLDKGHNIAKSFVKLGHDTYFLTTNDDYSQNGIKYISINNITDSFLSSVDYILISREALFMDLLEKVPSFKKSIQTPSNNRSKPKFIIKSDSPVWYLNKKIKRKIRTLFRVSLAPQRIKRWIIQHVDFICCQNEDFRLQALNDGIPRSQLLISNMGVPNVVTDYKNMINPYDINHSYCVDDVGTMNLGKALFPIYYIENPDQKVNFNTKKKILIYTGRIKTDNGKILFNMRNIMDILGDDYELHIFPGTFLIPSSNPNGRPIKSSGKNANSLDLLRKTIFKNSKNVIIHYPYEHSDKYRYLHFADCGIDFSDVRPRNVQPMAGHAKILEYCEVGVPIVCEQNIHNNYLVKNGKNGIVLPYMASDDEYVNAIKTITSVDINREYCRKLTIANENWDRKASELLKQASFGT